MEIPLGHPLLLFEDIVRFLSLIIWRYHRILKSYYIRVPIMSRPAQVQSNWTGRTSSVHLNWTWAGRPLVPIGQQRDVTMLIFPIPIPNAIGSIRIGSLQRKIKLQKFGKTNDSFGFLDSAKLWSNYLKNPYFRKRAFLRKQWIT